MPTKSEGTGRLAILAIDPGGTSGVAAGYIERKPTLKEALLGIQNKKVAEVEGNWLEQSAKIATIMATFCYRANVEAQIPLDDIHIVLEDFVLRRRREGGATGNLTSCWVAAGAVALYCGHPLRYHTSDGELAGFETWSGQPEMISWQQASQAKSFAKNQRMKMWELWERGGSEHCRDAMRHLATKANDLL